MWKRLAVLVGTAAVVAACGGGSGGSGSEGGGGPIKVGMVGPYSGPVATVGVAAKEGATAYIKYVNESGGIDGRKIEITSYDDRYTVGETVSSVRRLVQQDKVVALVSSPVGGPHTQAIAEYAGSKKLPIVGPFQGLPELNAEPTVFPTWATIKSQMYAVADYIYQQKKDSKVAIMYYNDASGKATKAGVTAAAEANGASVVADIPFEASATDLTSEVQKAQSSGADALIMMAGTGQVATAMKTAADLGYSPQWGGHTTISDPALSKLAGKAAEGAIGAAIFDTDKADSEEMTRFYDLMEKYFPGSTPTSFNLSGYTGAVLLVEALRQVKGDITGPNLTKALESGKTFDVGTLPGLTYEPGDHVGNPLVRVVTIKDGSVKTLTDWISADGS
ncbi:ABC transporter substrate-binding protein [soil metagenome]